MVKNKADELHELIKNKKPELINTFIKMVLNY